MTLDSRLHAACSGIIPPEAGCREDLLRRVTMAQSPEQRAILARQLGYEAWASYYTDRAKAQVLDRVGCVLREHSREPVRR